MGVAENLELPSSTDKVYELLLRVNAQLSVDRFNVCLNSPNRHSHEFGNLLLAVTLSQKTCNLDFTLGKREALKRSKNYVIPGDIDPAAWSCAACRNPEPRIHGSGEEHNRDDHKSKGHRRRKQSGRLKLRKANHAQYARNHHIAEKRRDCVRQQKRHGKRGEGIVRIMGLISKNKPKQQAKNSAPHDHNLLAGTHGPRSGIRHKEEPREQHDRGKWPYKTRKPLKRATLETVRQNNAGQTYRKPVLRRNRWRKQGTVKWAKSHGTRNGSNYQKERQKPCYPMKRLNADAP